MANNFGETSPGPAIYSCHMEIGVGCKPTIPKHRSNQSVVPILKGEYLRGEMHPSHWRRRRRRRRRRWRWVIHCRRFSRAVSAVLQAR